MTEPEEYYVALFESISQVLRSEKILKNAGIPHKLIPVPRHISSDCGVCLRFTSNLKKQIEDILAGKVDVIEMRQL
ncbi:MAG: DUF3343 domain-containing protein [Deltaproteobacteria bacterium]|nr:DUF3343 domain-containing protein [Deltaproteobacteria bacterium]